METRVKNIQDVALVDALGERYLAYALSTITSRSLPDVRDGLKPVHRRILYAMRELHLNPQSGYKKCARVVGDVLGRFHPHGDTAVYDTMVRLAQDFSLRYPLVDGQGNFGSIDGDNAAAMRYTEARLTSVGVALMEGLDEDAVDFRPNYDETTTEPVVMPAAFPQLLANGSTGIAVGMATNIPPHNVAELCDAMIHLLHHPHAPAHDLMTVFQGPDFPTGGIIVENKETIAMAYETGRGSFRLRARYRVDPLKNGLYQIVVYEIPYQVQKSKLIEKIAELLDEKKLPLLQDIRDESADDVRLVLEPKSRAVVPDQLMEQLFRATDLEVRFNMNMNVLDKDQRPQVMGLPQVLHAFLDHRHTVLVRRSNFRLGKIVDRLVVLDGYLIAYLNLDQVIQIIRENDDPKPLLIGAFKLNDIQADAILNMRLRALRKLEEIAIRREYDTLSKERDALQDLLSNEKKRWKKIEKDILHLRENFGPDTSLGARRTGFELPTTTPMVMDTPMIEKEPITVFCSLKGWMRAMKGHGLTLSDIKYKEGDAPRFVLEVFTTDKLLMAASDGRFYTLSPDKLPRGRGMGEPIQLMVDLKADDAIVAMIPWTPGDETSELLVASKDGKGFRVRASDVVASTKNGKQIMTLDNKNILCCCVPVTGDAIAVIGSNRKMIVFMRDEVPLMNRGKGVIFQRYAQGHLSDIASFRVDQGLAWITSRGPSTPGDIMRYRLRRGGMGLLAPSHFPRTNRFS